jgi:hypothetical protein
MLTWLSLNFLQSIRLLRLPKNITPSEYGGVAGSSLWRLWAKFMGFIHRLSFTPNFTGSIHGLIFLLKITGFIHRLSFLPKFGTNVAWWPFSTPQFFAGYHNLPKVSRCNVKHQPHTPLTLIIHPNVVGCF